MEPGPERRYFGIGSVQLLIVAIALHFGAATHHLWMGNLAGHEFRQTQTALSILFIQQENDFSLAYPTPLFGPPWSIPMEFPLYQWTVAKVVNATNWSIPFAARTVSLICFYLTLPAIYLLLRRWKFSVDSSRLSLALILITPVYVFYSRAVLIESMALMASIWFLWAFDRMCRHPHLGWAAIAALAGGVAVLVKVTTFIPWCAAAAVIGLSWSWREWKTGGIWPWLKTVGWGALVASIPGIGILSWLRFSDAIKAQSPGGAELSSDALSSTNFGGWQDRVGGESLTSLIHEMGKGTLPWWLLATIVIGGVFSIKKMGRKALILVLWFGGTLMVFPVLYHRHDYYFYAVAVMPVCGLALVLDHWQRHRLLRWGSFFALAGIVAIQANSYHRNYWDFQHLFSNGGTGLTNFMRDMLPIDGAIVVLGHDWAPTVPYYAQRRGVMLRQNVVNSPERLLTHLENLTETKISAMLVADPTAQSSKAIHVITKSLGLESQPSITHAKSELYLADDLRSPTLIQLAKHMTYSDVVIIGTPDAPPPAPVAEPIVVDSTIHPVTPLQSLITFEAVTPAPYQYRCKFGLGASYHDGRSVIGAHPDSDMWIRIPAKASTLSYQIGMDSGTFKAVGDSDGVIFKVLGIDATGRETELAEHTLDPAHHPEQRIPQSFKIDLPPGIIEIILSTRPRETYNFDWAYWGTVVVQ